MAAPMVRFNFQPRWYQKEAHARRKRFSVLVWHRRSGKTVFAIMELILAALSCKRERGQYAYIAPFYGQAKEVAWEYMKSFARQIPSTLIREGELRVIFPNKSSIRLYGADNPDSLRGLYFDGVVLDEVADMRDQVWGEIIRPALADREGWALFIGTPKGINLFSKIYQNAIVDDAWHADMRRASETGILPESELLAAQKEMSPNQYAQEFECDFTAAVIDAVIPLDLAISASRRTARHQDFSFAPVVLGVDVAYAESGDRSVIALRQGVASCILSVYRGMKPFDLAAEIDRFWGDWGADACFIDFAMGTGVHQALQQMGRNAVLVNFGSGSNRPEFANKRADMWFAMREWLQSGGCLEDRQDLIADLTGITWKTNTRGQKQLESKEKLPTSPDLADALALTFAFQVSKKSSAELLGIRSKHGGVARNDYEKLR